MVTDWVGRSTPWKNFYTEDRRAKLTTSNTLAKRFNYTLLKHKDPSTPWRLREAPERELLRLSCCYSECELERIECSRKQFKRFSFLSAPDLSYRPALLSCYDIICFRFSTEAADSTCRTDQDFSFFIQVDKRKRSSPIH